MPEVKIIKTLKLDSNANEEYQVNAVKLEGKSVTDIKNSVTTDNLQAGSETWIFDCGTATINVE